MHRDDVIIARANMKAALRRLQRMRTVAERRGFAPPEDEPDDDIPEWEAGLRKAAVYRAKKEKLERGRAPLLTTRELRKVLP